MKKENKWQRYFRRELYNGRMPTSKIGKQQYELLGNVGDSLTVHFPEFETTDKSRRRPAHTETYKVTFDDCNIPEGRISVSVLASNLVLWTSRGHRIDY